MGVDCVVPTYRVRGGHRLRASNACDSVARRSHRIAVHIFVATAPLRCKNSSRRCLSSGRRFLHASAPVRGLSLVLSHDVGGNAIGRGAGTSGIGARNDGHDTSGVICLLRSYARAAKAHSGDRGRLEFPGVLRVSLLHGDPSARGCGGTLRCADANDVFYIYTLCVHFLIFRRYVLRSKYLISIFVGSHLRSSSYFVFGPGLQLLRSCWSRTLVSCG